MKRPLRICIDARFVPGYSGGIENVVAGLVYGLSSLQEPAEKYHILAYEKSAEWLSQYMKGSWEVLTCGIPNIAKLKRTISTRHPKTKALLEKIGSINPRMFATIPHSPEVIERAEIDLMHFALQSAFRTTCRSIYHPHDLQHIHLPEYFSNYERTGRSLKYKSFCDAASLVAVSSSWVKDDVAENLGVPKSKIAVVPLAPATELSNISLTPSELATVKKDFDLPEQFAFYPAQTWPHKNHIALVEAIAVARDRYGLKIPLVLAGRHGSSQASIQRRIEQLRLTDQVRSLGFIAATHLQALYKLCRLVVIPSKFEAASFPLWEAFLAGAPATCSTVTSLPRQANGAALLFKEDDVEGMAKCVCRIWTDDALRRDLVERGTQVISQFTWTQTAHAFRAHYRRILGSPLSPLDQRVLDAAPII